MLLNDAALQTYLDEIQAIEEAEKEEIEEEEEQLLLLARIGIFMVGAEVDKKARIARRSCH